MTIVKHSVGDASSVSVSSHVLHNTHYVVSAHLKSILIDISEMRLINYARCCAVLWLITYLRKNDLHARLVLQLLTGGRQINLFTFLDVAVTGLPQVIYSGSGGMKFINPLNPSGCYITHVPAVLTVRTPAFGPYFAFRSVCIMNRLVFLWKQSVLSEVIFEVLL